jgi:hypothetical protein
VLNEEYKRVLQKYGGAISPADCHEVVWECYVEPALIQAQRKAQFTASPLKKQWEGRPVLTAVVNSNNINACALPGIEADYILIYRGLMERVLGYTLALFSTQEYLPTVGEAGNELPFSRTMEQFGQRANLKTGRAPLEPRCQIRATSGLILSILAINTVVSHEFGHIVGGHFDLMRDARTVPAGIDELRAQKGDLDLSIPLACIEWDADHYASALCWSTLDAMPFPASIIDCFAKTFNDRQSMPIVIWSLGAHALFRCLAMAWSVSYIFDPNKYPPPSLRGFFFVLDMLKRTSFVHGANRERDAEVFRFVAQAENLEPHDGVIVAGHDWGQSWFQTRPDWYERMGKLFQKHRDQLEAVRRTQVTWRPIWKENA